MAVHLESTESPIRDADKTGTICSVIEILPRNFGFGDGPREIEPFRKR